MPNGEQHQTNWPQVAVLITVMLCLTATIITGIVVLVHG